MTELKIKLLIHIIGFFIFYVILKLGRDKNKENTWKDVFQCFCFSLIWPGVVTGFIIQSIYYCIEKFVLYIIKYDYSKIKFPKPPKWL